MGPGEIKETGAHFAHVYQGLHSNGVDEAGGQQFIPLQYPQGVDDDVQQNLLVGPIPLSLRMEQGSQQQETGRR